LNGRDRTPHPSQQRILDVVAARPGASVQQISEEVGLTRTSTLHHLRRLARRGAVLAVRQGRRLTHFPASIRESSQHTLLGLMHVLTARLLVEALAQDPEVSWRRLAQRLGVTPRAVRWHVRRLQEDGLLRVEGTGKLRHVTVLDEGLAAVVQGVAAAPPATAPPAAGVELSPFLAVER